MSRSVAEQRYAELVKYTHFDYVYGYYNPETDQYEGDEYNDEATRDEVDCLIENLKWSLKKAFPSFTEVPENRDRQNRDEREMWQRADDECFPILANGNCVVYLAEYCGLVSISFVPAGEIIEECWYHGYNPLGLQKHWIHAAEKRINTAIESVCDRLICQGHFSNGEAVFAPVTPRTVLKAIVNGEAV